MTATQVTTAMVPVDGGEVWAEDSGGERPPLVLLHPGVGDARFWDPVLPALTAKYRCIRYDARGYGHSPIPLAEYSLYEDLLSVLAYYQLDRVALAGCSMGGATGLSLAVEQPDRLAALALLAPGIPGYPWDDEPAPDETELEAERDQAYEAGDVAAVAAWMGKVWAAGDGGLTPAVQEQLRSAAVADLASGELEEVNPPAWDKLGSIAIPTALLVGDKDYPPLFSADQKAAARIPGCELVIVPGVDHLPALRVPDQVTELILRTLERAGW